MITINNIKLNIAHSDDDLKKKICHILRIKEKDLKFYEIYKKSLDFRDKNVPLYVYSIEALCENERAILKKHRNNNSVFLSKRVEYKSEFINDANKKTVSPIVVGAGPAGLFCAYELAKAGLKPIILERGEKVDDRKVTIQKFWETGILNQNSNVQFGEGGAGTFSDGKLNTRIKDPYGRARYILKILVSMGAKKSILYDYSPHIGTDVLEVVLKNLRDEIEKMGGTFRFQTRVTDFIIKDSKVKGVVVHNDKSIEEKIFSDKVILAIGHSARDTFLSIANCGIEIKEKPFAIGIRIELRQEMVNKARYGENYDDKLPQAEYKFTYKCKSGRGVYTFCMCPGGYIVNASSKEGFLAINGMSYSKRDGENANSAVICTVTPDDYKEYKKTNIPKELSGMIFQEALEKKAYEQAKGKIPIQLYEDFKDDKLSSNVLSVKPSIKGMCEFGLVSKILPDYVKNDIVEAIEEFGKKMKGFNERDSIVAGVETRTSSPIKILRDDNFESNIKGLYPCGEGAGYAGGIISAAVDGIKVAEKVKMW